MKSLLANDFWKKVDDANVAKSLQNQSPSSVINQPINQSSKELIKMPKYKLINKIALASQAISFLILHGSALCNSQESQQSTNEQINPIANSSSINTSISYQNTPNQSLQSTNNLAFPLNHRMDGSIQGNIALNDSIISDSKHLIATNNGTKNEGDFLSMDSILRPQLALQIYTNNNQPANDFDHHHHHQEQQQSDDRNHLFDAQANENYQWKTGRSNSMQNSASNDLNLQNQQKSMDGDAVNPPYEQQQQQHDKEVRSTPEMTSMNGDNNNVLESWRYETDQPAASQQPISLSDENIIMQQNIDLSNEQQQQRQASSISAGPIIKAVISMPSNYNNNHNDQLISAPSSVHNNNNNQRIMSNQHSRVVYLPSSISNTRNNQLQQATNSYPINETNRADLQVHQQLGGNIAVSMSLNGDEIIITPLVGASEHGTQQQHQATATTYQESTSQQIPINNNNNNNSNMIDQPHDEAPEKEANLDVGGQTRSKRQKSTRSKKDSGNNKPLNDRKNARKIAKEKRNSRIIRMQSKLKQLRESKVMQKKFNNDKDDDDDDDNVVGDRSSNRDDSNERNEDSSDNNDNGKVNYNDDDNDDSNERDGQESSHVDEQRDYTPSSKIQVDKSEKRDKINRKDSRIKSESNKKNHNQERTKEVDSDNDNDDEHSDQADNEQMTDYEDELQSDEGENASPERQSTQDKSRDNDNDDNEKIEQKKMIKKNKIDQENVGTKMGRKLKLASMRRKIKLRRQSSIDGNNQWISSAKEKPMKSNEMATGPRAQLDKDKDINAGHESDPTYSASNSNLESNSIIVHTDDIKRFRQLLENLRAMRLDENDLKEPTKIVSATRKVISVESSDNVTNDDSNDHSNHWTNITSNLAIPQRSRHHNAIVQNPDCNRNKEQINPQNFAESHEESVLSGEEAEPMNTNPVKHDDGQTLNSYELTNDTNANEAARLIQQDMEQQLVDENKNRQTVVHQQESKINSLESRQPIEPQPQHNQHQHYQHQHHNRIKLATINPEIMVTEPSRYSHTGSDVQILSVKNSQSDNGLKPFFVRKTIVQNYNSDERLAGNKEDKQTDSSGIKPIPIPVSQPRHQVTLPSRRDSGFHPIRPPPAPIPAQGQLTNDRGINDRIVNNYIDYNQLDNREVYRSNNHAKSSHNRLGTLAASQIAARNHIVPAIIDNPVPSSLFMADSRKSR